MNIFILYLLIYYFIRLIVIIHVLWFPVHDAFVPSDVLLSLQLRKYHSQMYWNVHVYQIIII